MYKRLKIFLFMEGIWRAEGELLTIKIQKKERGFGYAGSGKLKRKRKRNLFYD